MAVNLQSKIRQARRAGRVEDIVRKLQVDGDYPSRRKVGEILRMEHMSLAQSLRCGDRTSGRFLLDTDKANITVLVAGIRSDLAMILDNTGVLNWLPGDRIFREEDERYSATIQAVRRANQLLAKGKSDHLSNAATGGKLYIWCKWTSIFDCPVHQSREN